MPTIRRECCPECNTTQIIKRGNEYGCSKCQAQFETPALKLVYKMQDGCASCRITIEKEMESLRQIQEEHPEYTRKDMRMVSGCSDVRIREHFKLYDVHYVRRQGT